jgi:hypothetical protein
MMLQSENCVEHAEAVVVTGCKGDVFHPYLGKLNYSCCIKLG